MDLRRSYHHAGRDHRRQQYHRCRSVVTNDIPSNVIAGGNPCRVIRAITEKDKLRSFSWEEKKAKKQVKPA